MLILLVRNACLLDRIDSPVLYHARAANPTSEIHYSLQS